MKLSRPMRGRRQVSFSRCRRGAAAVEFALVGLALMLFFAALMELGMLGFSIVAQARGMQAAARHAALDASASAGSGNNPPQVDSLATIEGYFDQYADPPLLSSTAPGGPVVSGQWCTNPGTTNAMPSTYLILTVSNTWVPFGFNMFSSGFTIKLSTVAAVMGTNGFTKTACAPLT